MTDTTRTMTNATNKARWPCTTVGSAPADCSSRAAARRSESVAAADCGDVVLPCSRPTPTGSRTSAILP